MTLLCFYIFIIHFLVSHFSIQFTYPFSYLFYPYLYYTTLFQFSQFICKFIFLKFRQMVFAYIYTHSSPKFSSSYYFIFMYGDAHSSLSSLFWNSLCFSVTFIFIFFLSFASGI